MKHAPVEGPVRLGVSLGVAVAVFLFSWLLRFNDPSGSFGGLTDDHFFYLIRGWQILFGDLPVRDFVDHGAPGYFYVAAAVQALFGRGTLSELMFSTTVLSLGASLTFWLAARASGSIAWGLVAAVFHVFLAPRFYNYPKIIVYAVAIPALWAFADRPSNRRLLALAVITAAAFMLRHDHAVFVGAALVVLLAALRGMPWRDRVRHALVYGGLVVALLSPYLAFIQVNGGLRNYFQSAASWAERDRDRAEVVFPGVFDNPEGASEAAATGTPLTRLRAVYHDNYVAWQYYMMLALPVAAFAFLALGGNALRPGWPDATAKILMVAVLGAILNAGFFRHPLEARLADPSVPHAVLIAWLGASLGRLWIRRDLMRPALRRFAWPVRLGALAIAMPFLGIVALLLSDDTYRRLDKSALAERPRNAFERAAYIADYVRGGWPVPVDAEEGTMQLSLYLRACTEPADRILMTPYLPQVLTMADRAFAGGHADLRSGFFGTEEEQRTTVARLQQQSVPVVVFDAGEERGFRESFPIIVDYLDARYRRSDPIALTDRTTVVLLLDPGRPVRGRYEPLGLPCFR